MMIKGLSGSTLPCPECHYKVRLKPKKNKQFIEFGEMEKVLARLYM